MKIFKEPKEVLQHKIAMTEKSSLKVYNKRQKMTEGKKINEREPRLIKSIQSR